MPRQARIDAPGAVHHVIARGIEHRNIFSDDRDRFNFIERFGRIITETGTGCFAWSLMPNHFHLLLKTGRVPISTVMRRLLTGHAIFFNRRHQRCGHLFQNRYKSILCQEDAYLKELVRYIHLNPLRAKIVKDLVQLDNFQFCGHGVIVGHCTKAWQMVQPVLSQFGPDASSARNRYRQYIQNGIGGGQRNDLIGGGLIRSAGGWIKIRSFRKAGQFFKSDERILGDNDFVENVLREAGEDLNPKYALAAMGVNVECLIIVAAKLFSISPNSICGAGKARNKVKARRVICYWGVHELGLSMTAIAKKLDIALSTVSRAVQLGEKIVLKERLSLAKLLNIEI